MICPNCKTNIPDDYKFCPDCGTPVVNIDELRAKAKEITVQFKKGYNFYVNDGTLPRFVYNLTAANYEKIVAMETEIINKHLLIENEELKKAEEQRKIKEANRRAEEQRIREIASGITIQYAKAYNYYVSIGVLPRFVHNLDLTKCQQIIAKKNDIIAKHNEIIKQEREDEDNLLKESEAEEWILPLLFGSGSLSFGCMVVSDDFKVKIVSLIILILVVFIIITHPWKK